MYCDVYLYMNPIEITLKPFLNPPIQTHEEKYLRRHKLTASSDMMYNAKKYSEEEIKYAREDFVTPDPSRRNTRETDKLRSEVLGHNPSDKRQNPITGGITIAPLYEDSPSPLQGHEGYVYRLGDTAKRSSILVIFGYIQHEIESPHNLSIPDKTCWLIFDYYYIAMMLYDYKEIGIMTQIEGGALFKIEPLSDGYPNGFRDTNGFSESHPKKLSSLRMGSSRTGSSRTGSSRTGSSRTVSWRTGTGSTCTNTTASSSSKRSRASKRRTVSDSGALKYYEYRTKYMVMEKRSKQYLSEHQNVRYRMLEKRKLLEGVSKHSLFIMKLHYAFQTANDLYLIYNHFPGGSLRSALHRHHTFSEDVARIWIASLSSAIGYLHSYGIFHIDLSLEHVLLDEMGHVHLTNIIPKSFSFKKSDHLSTAKTGYNIAYYAPEIVQNLEYSPSADWWTIGIILYELCTGSTPFYDENIDKMYKRIVNEQFDAESCPDGMSDECKDLMGALLVKDEASRLGAKNDANDNFVLKHSFFADLNTAKLERKEIDSLYIPVILDDGKMETVDDGKETFDDLVVGDGDHKIIDFLHFDDFVL